MQQDLFAEDEEEKWRLIRPNSTRVTVTPRNHNERLLPHLREHGLVIAKGCPGCVECNYHDNPAGCKRLVMIHLDNAAGPWDSYWWDLEDVELGAPDRPADWQPRWLEEEEDDD
jgi:hypothetical protein